MIKDKVLVFRFGPSACKYSGGIDPDNDRCHEDNVRIETLPVECSDLLYDGIKIDDNFLISPTYFPTDIDRIKDLIENSPSVFLYYNHQDIQAWFKAVDPENTLKEAQKLKEFISMFPVSGLILKEINYHYELNLDYNVPDNFYTNLANYVTTIKNEIPNLSIGLYLEAKSMIFYSTTTTSTISNWFNFTTLNEVMDLYLFGFKDFNECNSNFLNGGITPLDSPDPTDPSINTLSQLGIALSESTISKDIVYLEYLINPSVNKQDEMNFLPCEISYNEYCENPDYKYTWCADNEVTFFEKGKFAAEYAAGFVGKDIDLVDRDLKCECDEDKFITFHMILNGLTGLEMKKCGKINGS
ncbi:uncharacterized protein LOC113560395 [Rhopalosiphum maidis]|uniref:uncharacterized protein LOC113560395 n=1 Tax=Rhopalosiphum maidis TaxID=43146 RepID=UPI000EFF64A0|nr:uncharacterized protein LOC113560395 [Rhopalosiphum maidis]